MKHFGVQRGPRVRRTFRPRSRTAGQQPDQHCFCECGRIVTVRSGLLETNRDGNVVAGLLEALQVSMRRSGLAPGSELVAWLEEGHDIARLLASVIHGRARAEWWITKAELHAWQAELDCGGLREERERIERLASRLAVLRVRDKGDRVEVAPARRQSARERPLHSREIRAGDTWPAINPDASVANSTGGVDERTAPAERR